MVVRAILGCVAILGATSFAGAGQVAATRPVAVVEPVRHWAPAKPFDFDRMVLSLDLPDLTKQEVMCWAELSISTVATRATQLVLDARSETMHIGKVMVNGKAAVFKHEDRTLTIDLLGEMRRGDRGVVRVEYVLKGPFPKGTGLIFTPAAVGYSAHVFSQGETDYSSYWFPCRDEPDTKIGVTELLITPPAGTEALGSGELMGKEAVEGGRERFHFKLEKPNAVYLTAVAMGTFERLELADPAGKVGMGVYRPVGVKEAWPSLFKRTPEMLAFFRETLGVEYPWPNYRQLLVKGFDWNGMENTTLTTIDLEINSDEELELTIAHELFHQWFGDMVTCKTWDHVWIQEGWATYAEGLWAEQAGGKAAYRKLVERWLRELTRRSRQTSAKARPLVSNRWGKPDDTFDSGEDPYTRGGFFLHMLRARIGDDAFFRGTTLFLKRHAYASVETNDLRRAYEEASGDSLDQFFDQWLYRAGVPRLSVGVSWVEGDKSLVVRVKQTQAIDELHPSFRMGVPVRIGEKVYEARGEGESRFVLGAKPEEVVLDPELVVMGTIGVEEGELKVSTPGRDPTRRRAAAK